jgi:arylsulfatase A-like enzyme/Flp pilus assembly protein TadD
MNDEQGTRALIHRFLLALIIASTCARREWPKPNVLLITLDTFRADRVGPLTPALKALAGRGVVFENADAAVPLTLPSHATILSGLLPLHHGVRLNGVGSFPETRETLATLFSRGGYRTGAFVSAFVLDHRFGLNRGFDTYDDGIPRDPTGEALTFEAERRGGETVDRAIEWIRGRSEQRWFAWVHLYDAHAPYAPPSPYPQSYDGEVRYVDAQVGRLLSSIDPAKTIVVVVGDHGEALGEHGELTHGLLLYEPTLHVPMIVAAPASRPRVIRDPVSTVDVAPTIAALAGLSMTNVDGHEVPAREQALIYAETEYPTTFGWSALDAARSGSMKLIRGPTAKLFDLSRDPRESTNVAPQQRRAYSELSSRLQGIAKTALAPATAPVDEETRSKLASLGYVAPAGARATGADPELMAPLFRRFEEATQAINRGHRREAISTLEQLVHDDPSNAVFRSTLGHAYRAMGDSARAISFYRQSVAIAPADADAWYNLAAALEESGNAKEAVTVATEAQRLDPKRPEVHNVKGAALAETENPTAAEAEFRAAIALDPRNARAYNNLGNVLRALGRAADAGVAYQKAIELAPRYVDPLNGYGALLVQDGRAAEGRRYLDAALAIAPDFAEARLNRAIALQVAGDTGAAVSELRSLLQRLPSGPQRSAARRLLMHIESLPPQK